MGKPKDRAGKKSQQSSHGAGGGKAGKGGKDAARQDKATERQEKTRLKKDRQRNSIHYYRSDEDDRQFEAQVNIAVIQSVYLYTPYWYINPFNPGSNLIPV